MGAREGGREGRRKGGREGKIPESLPAKGGPYSHERAALGEPIARLYIGRNCLSHHRREGDWSERGGVSGFPILPFSPRWLAFNKSDHSHLTFCAGEHMCYFLGLNLAACERLGICVSLCFTCCCIVENVPEFVHHGDDL